MMRRVLGCAGVLLFVAGGSAGILGAACGDSSAPAATPSPVPEAGTDAGADSAPPGPVSVSISPTTLSLLTCSTQTFAATVTGSMDTSVTWTVTPDGIGTVDTNGKYTAPSVVPQPPTAKVTATTLANQSKSASASVTLATAFVGKGAAIAGSATTAELESRVGVYPHSFAANGKRAYGVWTSNPANGSAVSMKIARSDDGGATWKPAVTAISATLKSPLTTVDAWIECPAVTIDPQNPDIVYVVGKITASNSLATSVNADDQTTVLAVSKDGGATFTTRVMHVGGGDTCPDVSAPAANTIVVEAPAQQNCDGAPDMRLWSDAANGAGFATGTLDASNHYIAAGLTNALINVNKSPMCSGRIVIGQNGTTGNGGEATEAPRLFTNGKGALCITYIGTLPTDGGTTTNAYVQCSTDAGVSFSDPLNLDPDRVNGIDHSAAIGSFSPDGTSIAVLWVNSPNANNQTALPYLAVSKDLGKTFTPPTLVPTYVAPGMNVPVPAVNPTIAFDASGVLWLAYRSNDGTPSDRLIVDKTCDLGKTWSGAVLVNGPEAAVPTNGMKWPALITSSSAAPSVVASATAGLTVFTLAP